MGAQDVFKKYGLTRHTGGSGVASLQRASDENDKKNAERRLKATRDNAADDADAQYRSTRRGWKRSGYDDDTIASNTVDFWGNRVNRDRSAMANIARGYGVDGSDTIDFGEDYDKYLEHLLAGDRLVRNYDRYTDALSGYNNRIESRKNPYSEKSEEEMRRIVTELTDQMDSGSGGESTQKRLEQAQEALRGVASYESLGSERDVLTGEIAKADEHMTELYRKLDWAQTSEQIQPLQRAYDATQAHRDSLSSQLDKTGGAMVDTSVRGVLEKLGGAMALPDAYQGKYYVVPTDGETEITAMKRFFEGGSSLGEFDTLEEAQAYADSVGEGNESARKALEDWQTFLLTGADPEGNMWGIDPEILSQELEITARTELSRAGFDTKEIANLIEYTRRQINAEHAISNREQMSEWAGSSAGASALATAFSAAISPGRGLGLLESARSAMSGSDYGTLDPNSPLFAASSTSDAMRQGIMEETDWNIGSFDAFDMLYSTAASGLDSVVGMVLGGNYGGAMLGASAAGSATQELSQRGASSSQALTGGIVSGIFEMLFENVSIGNFRALQEVAPASIRDAVKNVSKSMLVNLTEEGATEIANIIYDTLSMGDLSNYALAIQDYMAQGMSEDEAKSRAAKDLGMQVLEAAASGALMGGAFGTVGTAGSAYSTSMQNYTEQGLSQNKARLEIAKDVGRGTVSGVKAAGRGVASGIKAAGSGIRSIARGGNTETSGRESRRAAQSYENLMAEVADEDLARQRYYEMGEIGVSFEKAQAASTAFMIDPAQAYKAYAQGYNAAHGMPDSTSTPNAEAVGGLKPFTQREITNLSSGKKNKLLQAGADIVSFVRNALTDKASNEKLYMGKVPDGVANTIAENTGLAVSGYNVILPSDVVRHVVKKHGSEDVETARGQQAVTDATFAALPEVISAPDNVQLSGQTDGKGRRALVFDKMFDDGTVVTVQAVSEGQHSIIADTVYVKNKKNPQAGAHGEGSSALGHNVRDDLPQGSNNIIPQRGDGVKSSTGKGRTENGKEQGKRNAANDGGKRNGGAYPQGESGIMGGGAGENQGGGDAQRRIAEKRRDALKTKRIKQINTGDLGLSRGSKNKTLTVIPYDMYDAELKAISRTLYNEGIRVKFFTGTMEIRDDSGVYHQVRGMLKGDRMFIQADNENHTASQIADHESFHMMAQKDKTLVSRVAKKLFNKYGEMEMDAILEQYESAYAGIDPEGAAEELLADAYAGMNMFAGAEEIFGEGAVKYQRDVKAGVVEEQADYTARKDEQRTDAWLKQLGVQFPSRQPTRGSIGSISYDGEKINISGKTFAELEKDAGSEGDKASLESREVQRLKDQIEYLKAQMRETKVRKTDANGINKLAKDLAKEYSSELSVESISNALSELYDFMANSKELRWSDVSEKANKIAREVLESASALDDDMYSQYKGLRDYLRNTGLTLSEEHRADMIDYGEFRKKSFGSIKLVNDGLPVDVAFSELAEMYPEFFDDQATTHPADQLLRMSEVLDSLKPVYRNPFSNNMKEASAYLANEIIESFYEIPQQAPTFADKKRAELEAERTANRENVKRLLERERGRREKAVEKLKAQHRSSDAKARERRDATEIRAKIRRHSDQLAKKLLKPTDKQHIPEELRQPVAQLLEMINLESSFTMKGKERVYDGTGDPTKRTQALRELKSAYAEVRGEVIADPDLFDEGADPGLLSEAAALGGKRINEMSLPELRIMWNTVRAVEASITKSNEMLGLERTKTINETAKSLKKEMQNLKANQAYKGAIGMASDFMRMEMLKPVDYFRQLGEAGKLLWEDLRSAQDKYTRHIAQAEKDVKDMLGKTDISEWRGKKSGQTEFTTEGGDKISLTPAQVMHLYKAMQRPQAANHILHGGVRQAVTETKGIKLSQSQSAVRLTLADVGNIISTLSAEQKRVADEMGKYMSSTLAQWGNEASMAAYGYKKFNDKNYIPIRVDENYTVTESGKGADIRKKSRGFTKSTIKEAKNALMIGDMFDVFAQHVNDMADYSAWLLALEDVERVKNFKFRETFEDEESHEILSRVSGSAKEEMERAMGKAGVTYLDTLLEDINKGNSVKSRGFSTEKLMGTFKAAAVGGNVRVVIQQPTAILRAAAVINTKYLLAKGVGMGLNKEAMYTHAPIAQWKDWGFFETSNGRQIQDILLDSTSKMDKTREFFMALAGKADSKTWGRIWNACEMEVRDKRPELEQGGDAYYKAVAERFNEIIDRTQVVDGILQRNQTMRDKNALKKMATSFMAEPITSYSMVVSAAYDVARSKKGSEARTEAKGRLAKASLAVLAADVFCAALASIVDAMRDDDKDQKYWEKWLEAFVGIDGDEETAGDYIGSIAGSGAVAQVNPLGKIPFVKDVLSIIEGYDVKRMDMESVAKFMKSLNGIVKIFKGESSLSFKAGIVESIAAGARFLGLPLANLKRDISAVISTVMGATGSWGALYAAEKLIYPVESDRNRSRYLDMAYFAWIKEDKSQYDLIAKDLIEHGYTQEDIDKGIQDRLKEDKEFKGIVGPVIEEIKSGIEGKEMFSEFDEDTQKKVLGYADEFAIKTQLTDEFKGYEMPTWIINALAAEEYGIDTAEYILFKAALEMVQGDKDANGDTIAGTAALHTIDMLNDMPWLTDEERAHLYGTKYTVKSENAEALEMSDWDYIAMEHKYDHTELWDLYPDHFSVQSESELWVADYISQLPESEAPTEAEAEKWAKDLAGGKQYGLTADEYFAYNEMVKNTTADKDSDGNAITGSKQAKIIDELNSMKWLTDKERGYLYGTNYSVDGTKAKSLELDTWDYIELAAIYGTDILKSDKVQELVDLGLSAASYLEFDKELKDYAYNYSSGEYKPGNNYISIDELKEALNSTSFDADVKRAIFTSYFPTSNKNPY